MTDVKTLLYEAFDLPDVEDFLPLSRTIHTSLVSTSQSPTNKNILPMLSALSPEAKALGAVNTLVEPHQDGKGTTPTFGDFNAPFNPS